MFNKWIAKHIGFPVQDLVKGTNIIKELAFLRESQYWDEERIHEYRLKKLKRFSMLTLRKNVPYYDELFQKIINYYHKNDIKHIR